MINAVNRLFPFVWTILLSAILLSCQNQDYIPKPRGYYRIALPTKDYQQAETAGCPFYLEIPTYTNLADDNTTAAEPCWKNIDFPQFNATLHLSYFKIGARSTFAQLSEDARTFVFKHTTKATGIDQNNISIPNHNIYGLTYKIKGNTASNYQFYISDSTRNYLRGALYFNEKPNLDSIQPVLDFITEDIQHLIRTARWK